MKILFISRLYLPHLGGVEIHLKEISAVLIRMGHQVSIISYQHDKKLSLQTEYDGVKVYRIPFETVADKALTWDAIKKLEQVSLESDIIHVHDVFWWILPLYIKNRKKIFTTFHGWETKLPIPINSKIHRLLVSKLSRATIHVGDFIKKFYWDKPTSVTYGGINPKRFTKSNSFQIKNKKNVNEIKQFVFVGRLDRDTDILLYIDFLKALKEKKVMFEMTWVGDGKLRKECSKYGKVTGFVKNISKHIMVADLVFASSYLSILEAQLLGKIVCAFYSNSLKKCYLESFAGSKYMLVSGTVNGMLSKLEHLYSSRTFLEQCKKGAKEFAQKNTWESVVSIYLKLWEGNKK